MHHYKKNMLDVTTLVNKNLMKAILIKSKLLNKFRQGRTISSHAAYKKQRNIHVKLLWKIKKDFFNNLDIKRVTDNKQNWKTVKPWLTDETLKDERITLTENGKVVSDQKESVKILGLLNCMSCVIKTCSRANVSHMLTCSRASVPCVLTCSRAYLPCVRTCWCTNVPCVCVYVLTCLRSLRAYVLTC